MSGLRVLVCGGRDFTEAALVARTLGAIKEASGIEVLIHGSARGADLLADEWGLLNGLRVRAFPADWTKYGKAAGPIRNAEMLMMGAPDLVVAFPGGRGTADMVSKARAAKPPVPVIEVRP